MAEPAAPEMPPPGEPAAPARAAPAEAARPTAPPTIFERARASPITFAITAINIGLFVYVEYYAGGTTRIGVLLRFGALEPFHVWAGEYWRLATAMFLHIGMLHIAVNTYMSIGWSTVLERVLGKKRFLLLYLLSGIGGNCLSVISSFLSHPRVSAGASGALFGIVGATLAIRRRQFSDNRSFLADRGVRSIALQFGLLTVVGLTVMPFDNSAHVGGLVTGAALGTLFTSRAARNGALALGAALAVLFVFAVRPWWSPTGTYRDKIAEYANAYLTGKDGAQEWPVDVARGMRFAEKGCARGVGRACDVLAEHLDRTDPASTARAEELRRRACDLDPPLCAQQR